MVIWADYLTSMGSAFGTTSTEAGIIFSLMFTIGLLIVTLIATRGRKPEVSITMTSLFTTVFFTFIGWYPVWIGSVLALVISLLLAMFISGKF